MGGEARLCACPGNSSLPSHRQIDLPSLRPVRDDAAPGGYSNVWDSRLPIEEWNAELSLLVGMGAAELQVGAPQRGAAELRVSL